MVVELRHQYNCSGSKKVKIVGSAAAYPLSLDSTDSDYALEFQRNGTSEWWLKASSSNFQFMKTLVATI